MPQNKIDIQTPLRGLSDDMAFGDQEPGTTRDALNMRSIDPRTGRTRLSQRAGLKRFVVPDSQLSGSNKVQDLTGITVNNDLLTYGDANSGDTEEEWATDLPSSKAVSDIRMDDFGCIYVAINEFGVAKYNQDGSLVASIEIERNVAGNPVDIGGIAIDPFGNIYIAVDNGATSPTNHGRLIAFILTDTATYTRAWTLDSGNWFADVEYYNNQLYCLENSKEQDESSDDSADYVRFTVYPDILNSLATTTAPTEDETKRVTLESGDSSNDIAWGQRLAVADDGTAYCACLDPNGASNAARAQIVKVNPEADDPTIAEWRVTNYTDTTADVDELGGIGSGVVIGPDDTSENRSIYTTGPDGPVDTNIALNRIIDQGDAPVTGGTGDSWEADFLGNGAARKTIDTDKDGNVYVIASSAGDDVRIYDKDGTELNSFSDADVGSNHIAVPKTKPTYQSGGPEEAELVFYEKENGAIDQLKAQRLVSATQGTGSPRTLTKVGVSDGDVVKFTASAVTSITGGAGAIDSTAQYVQSSTLGRSIYFVDGINNVEYDAEEDEVSDWRATDAGVVPKRCRLIETWRGRIVLGRDPEDPQLWHMSGVGNAKQWDNFPPVSRVTDPISGVNARAGTVPDIVNSIVPWDDDLLLFGGDKSIWRMTGDPLAGGQFDLITDETGMAFGRPWAKDPIGARLFFFGSRGGVYMMQRGSLPIRISRDRIERRLQDIDFENVYIRLVWNYRDEGLHVIQCPFGSGGTQLKHWFWDSKNDAWWEDTYGSSSDTNPQPTSVFLYDGDEADDRIIAFGCEDGRVRTWDEALKVDQTDSGNVNIDARVTMGPLLPPELPYETRFYHFTPVLARDQDGCSYRFYAQDEPDTLETPVAQGQLAGGRNATQPVRFRAANAWLTLANSTDGRFAVENMRILAAPAGRMRLR